MEPLRTSADVARFTSHEESHELDISARALDAAGDEVADMTHRLTLQSASFSGPLPAPPILAHYDRVLPGLAALIVEQWKSETQHRHETVSNMRRTDHEAMVRYYEGEKRGQRYAILAIFGILAVAIAAMVLDRLAVGVTGLLMGGAATIWAMRRRSGGPDAGASAPDRGVSVEAAGRQGG